MSDNFKERLKKLRESQGEVNSAPLFKQRIETRFEAKKDPKTNAPSFKYWDGEADAYYAAPIRGALIGSAMQLTAFNPNLKPKGGSYTSTIFYSYKDQAKVYSTHDKGAIFSGTAQECKDFITTKTRDSVKTHKIIWLLSEKGKLLQFSTNISLAINDLSMSKEKDFMLCDLTPTMYSPNDRDVTKKVHDMLGGLAAKNPPVYAKITVSNVEITEEVADKMELFKVLDEYDEFKKFFKEAREGEIDDIEKIASQMEYEDSKPDDYSHESVMYEGEPTDDLPF